MKKILPLFFLIFAQNLAVSQTNAVFYAGNEGKETFYDIQQISDGTFLICGYASNLDWVAPTVPMTQLSNTEGIHNALGTGRYGFLMRVSEDLQQVLQVAHFPKGAVEDVRFLKTNTPPYAPTGDLYISGNTADSDDNDGGYYLAKLDKNFLNGTPSTLVWAKNVWANDNLKNYQPWDVSAEGLVYYVTGTPFGYDWSAMYCLDQAGKRKVVNHWRTHWRKAGGEWRGTPAAAYPDGGADSLAYSGIVLKIWGRCDLRSWSPTDFDTTMADGNGGTRKGLWPTDILFSGPCDPQNPTATGPGYTGYSATACCPVHGGTSIAVDRRNGHCYLGMNMKSTSSGGSPDFEPAVIAMDSTGGLQWWSRLYHEVTPAGDTVESLPDQYVDALAIDYTNDRLVVGARCHGNAVENFWEGNTIYENPAATGFQNQFTGSNGNIHISWLGKLRLDDGTLTNSTYMAELFEGTAGLGSPHPDPNLDGWPNPNGGWPDVNTTRMAKNALKISSDGGVCVAAVGRRTITTANAYQKMVKPGFGGKSCWNSFVRVYDPTFKVPRYSSLLVGQWDTLTQMGGDNTEIFGLHKTAKGILCVGRQTANDQGIPNGNNIPVANVPSWGSSNPQGESAVLAYYQATNLYNPGDGPTISAVQTHKKTPNNPMTLWPNPTNGIVHVRFSDPAFLHNAWEYHLLDAMGRKVQEGPFSEQTIDLRAVGSGVYFLQICGHWGCYGVKMVVER